MTDPRGSLLLEEINDDVVMDEWFHVGVISIQSLNSTMVTLNRLGYGMGT